MKALYFVCLFLILGNPIKSQTYFDYATQPTSVEQPLGFVKYNTLTLLYSASTNYSSYNMSGYGANSHRIVGLNNNGTVRFDKIKSAYETNGPIQYSPTLDKGMLALSNVYMCLSQNSYNLTFLSRIDSMGNDIFNIGPLTDFKNGVAQVSGTNFIYTTGKSIIGFNGSTGASIAIVYTAQGHVSALNTTSTQNIIVATDWEVAVVDTLGNLLVSKPSTNKYSKIKSYKKTFYGLRANAITIDKLDSVLNIVGSINTFSTEPVTDFSIYNDSIAVSFYNKVSNLSSIKVYPVNTLTNSIVFSNNIIKHKIVALQKDSSYGILSAEIRTDVKVLCGAVCSGKHYSTGFTRAKTLASITYTNDIVLKSIKTQSFNITNAYSNQVSYSYQNSIEVLNNSMDTIKYFRISHPMDIFPMGSSFCGAHGNGAVYDKTVIADLAPFKSMEIQLPLLQAAKLVSSSTNFTITVCYDLSVPNHRIENNIVNSSGCINFVFPPVFAPFEGEGFYPYLYPNPTSDRITILSPKPAGSFPVRDVHVIDLSGRILLSPNNNKEIDVSALASGMYILTFEILGSYYQNKFVKE